MTDNPGQEPATRRDEILDTWNERVPVDSPVRYWRGEREGDGRIGRTRTAAQHLNGNAYVVWVDTTSGCISLTHVEPITEGEYEAEAQNQGHDASSATETPVQAEVGSRDDRTSETHTETRTDGETLRLMVRDFGEWFSARSIGRKVWQAAINLFADYEDATAMVLDFEGVQGITTTCADEMVPGLIRRMDDRVISVANASDQVAEALTTALARRGMAVQGIGEHVFFAALAEREQELRNLSGQLSDRDHQIATVRTICEDASALGPDAAGVAVAAVLAALADEVGDFEGITP